MYLYSKKCFYKSKCKRFGSNVIFFGNPVFYNMHNISLGNNVDINDWVIINAWADIVIWDNCCLSSYSQLQTAWFDLVSYPTKNHVAAPIVLWKAVRVWAGSIIVWGVSIWDHSIIGAWSIVTKNVPSWEIWAGSPARKLRSL